MLYRGNKGFSLIETLVAIAILVLILGLSLVPFVSMYRRESLTSSASALAEGLRDARARTLASVDGSQYGVKVDSDRFTFFKGSTFSSSTPENETFVFSSWVKASSTEPVFVFERVTGESSASGTIDMYLVTSAPTKKTIQVQSTGLVGIQ